MREILDSGIEVEVATAQKGDRAIFSDIFVRREYDDWILASLPCPEILDLGANVGYFAIRVAHLMKQAGNEDYHVTCVEGNPETVKILNQRLELAQLPASRVEVICGLAGEREGCVPVFSNGFHPCDTIMAQQCKKKFFRNMPVVTRSEFVDLDRLTHEEPIGLLKCDIEGAELLFIRNYPDLLRRTENAIFEFHGLYCDISECVRLIEEAGLKPQGPLPDHHTFTHFFRRG